ncbi:LTOR1 protein, partial [Upupa epops]|nr:LTOR1 protein [Upupa epops]
KEEETKRLLEPAASPPSKVLNGAEQSYHNLPSARTDEQAMLSSILAKTAIGSPPSLSEGSLITQGVLFPLSRGGFLLGSSSTPYFLGLSLPPRASLKDSPRPLGGVSRWQCPLAPQVSRIAAYAFSALSQIRVDAKEELVVQFGIP